jgi:hypothetical protein
MLRANNLSDLTNVALARTSLGLGTAATTAATAYATAAQGAKADTALQSVTAGSGISIDITDPLNPVITNTDGGEYVASGVVDYANNRIRLTLLGGGNVDIPFVAFPVIDGFTVKKGTGNTNFAAIEVGDYCNGWDGDRYLAFRVTGAPYTTESNRAYAIEGEI